MKRELKFAAKIWGYYLVMTLVCMMFTLGIGNTIVQMIMNLGLIVGFSFICFSEGAYLGEKGAALEENIGKQEKEGRRVLEELRDQVFNRKFAAVGFLIAIIPFLAVSALNAAYYPVYSQQSIVAEPEEVLPTENVQETDEAMAETAERPVHWARITAWFVMTPFSAFNQLLSDGVNAVLFFLYSMVLPGAAAVGYLCGPRLHVRKIKMMKKGSRRKARGLKVNRTPKSQKPVV